MRARLPDTLPIQVVCQGIQALIELEVPDWCRQELRRKLVESRDGITALPTFGYLRRVSKLGCEIHATRFLPFPGLCSLEALPEADRLSEDDKDDHTGPARRTLAFMRAKPLSIPTGYRYWLRSLCAWDRFVGPKPCDIKHLADADAVDRQSYSTTWPHFLTGRTDLGVLPNLVFYCN